MKAIEAQLSHLQSAVSAISSTTLGAPREKFSCTSRIAVSQLALARRTGDIVPAFSQKHTVFHNLNAPLVIRCVLLVLEDDVIDNAIFLGLIGIHDEVALDIALDLLQWLSTVFREQLIGNLAHA